MFIGYNAAYSPGCYPRRRCQALSAVFFLFSLYCEKVMETVFLPERGPFDRKMIGKDGIQDMRSSTMGSSEQCDIP